MSKKKFNSNFYNSSYYKLTRTSQASPDRVIEVDVLFQGKPIPKEILGFSEVRDAVLEDDRKLYVKIENLKELKKKAKELDVFVVVPSFIWEKKELEDGYLFSGWRTGVRTKIKPEDLPDDYVEVFHYKKPGFIKTSGVEDYLYVPSSFNKLSMKDDFLLISYDGKIKDKDSFFKDFDNKKHQYIFGSDIYEVAKKIGEISSKPELVKEVKKRVSLIKEKTDA